MMAFRCPRRRTSWRRAGIAVALAVLCGIVASFFAKLRTWQDLKRQAGHDSEQFWVRTWITYLGFVPDFALPLVFAFAWLGIRYFS
jgi:hypothetical protein